MFNNLLGISYEHKCLDKIQANDSISSLMSDVTTCERYSLSPNWILATLFPNNFKDLPSEVKKLLLYFVYSKGAFWSLNLVESSFHKQRDSRACIYQHFYLSPAYADNGIYSGLTQSI